MTNIKINALDVEMYIRDDESIEEKIVLWAGNTKLIICGFSIEKDFTDMYYSIVDDMSDNEELEINKRTSHFVELAEGIDEKDIKMYDISYDFHRELVQSRAEEMAGFMQDVENEYKRNKSQYAQINDSEKINYLDKMEKLESILKEHDSYAYSLAQQLLVKGSISDRDDSLKMKIMGLKS